MELSDQISEWSKANLGEELPDIRDIIVFADMVGQLEGEKARLLAVARAARTVVAHIELAREPNRPLGKSPIMSEALAEALAAVEDLL